MPLPSPIYSGCSVDEEAEVEILKWMLRLVIETPSYD